jgi:hypothetical protein
MTNFAVLPISDIIVILQTTARGATTIRDFVSPVVGLVTRYQASRLVIQAANQYAANILMLVKLSVVLHRVKHQTDSAGVGCGDGFVIFNNDSNLSLDDFQ